jgi:phage baseplate assembly protein W
MRQLSDPPYLAFPFRMEHGRPRLAKRAEHIRGQIEQLLFTLPGERVFRPEFGAGVRTLVFEPNSSALWQVAKKQLQSSLAEALAGEVDPKTIDIKIMEMDQSTRNEAIARGELIMTISYVLAAIGHEETHTLTVSGRTGHGV